MKTPIALDAGAWIGRQQAFAVMATHCSAAQAATLKHLKSAGIYQSLGLTWDDFCADHAGISRVHADRLISQLNEFGEAYFKLSQIARIAPRDYRQIAAQVTPEAIEFDGESIPLTPENAPKIRAAVRTLRAQLQTARQEVKPRPGAIAQLELRIDTMIRNVAGLHRNIPAPDSRAALRSLTAFAIDKWTTLARTMDALE